MIDIYKLLRIVGTIFGVLGALIIALNIVGFTKYSFIIFLLSSLCWIIVAIKIKEKEHHIKIGCPHISYNFFTLT